MSYSSSQYYAALKPIIRDTSYDTGYHTRNSSSDSHGSYHSRSSTGYSGRCSTSYSGSANQRTYDEYYKREHRVPDNERHSITTTRKAKVDTINHKQPRYDPDEPRASNATLKDYELSQSRSSKSSKSSKHK